MNLPNKLTLIRMALVPLIIAVWLIFEDNFITQIICVALFLLASLTDMLDGQIARKRNLITTFGKFMDPIADKLLVNSLLILLCYDHMIPVLCVLLMIGRDLIVDAVRLMAAQNQKVMAAGPLGKLKTVLQMIAIPVLMLNNLFGLGTILIWAATIVSVISGYDYFIKNKDMIFESI